jgi:pilus assembly protein CpaF
MIWALSTGHDGCFSTCHASSAVDALRRLETMATLGSSALPIDAVRAQVSAAVDVLVGVRRGTDGARRVHAVHQLDDHGTLRSLLEPDGTVRAPTLSRRAPLVDSGASERA